MLLKGQSNAVIQEALGHCQCSPYGDPILTYQTPTDHSAAGYAISVGKGIICARQWGICSLGGSVICYQSRGTRRGRTARIDRFVREKGGFTSKTREK